MEHKFHALGDADAFVADSLFWGSIKESYIYLYSAYGVYNTLLYKIKCILYPNAVFITRKFQRHQQKKRDRDSNLPL